MTNKPYVLTVRAVLRNDKNEILVLKRSKTCKNYPLHWELPGGKIDPGESFADALVREFKEEAGLDVQIERVIGATERERENDHVVYLIMEVSVITGTLEISFEHEESAWMNPQQIIESQTPPYMKDFVKQYLM